MIQLCGMFTDYLDPSVAARKDDVGTTQAIAPKGEDAICYSRPSLERSEAKGTRLDESPRRKDHNASENLKSLLVIGETCH